MLTKVENSVINELRVRAMVKITQVVITSIDEIIRKADMKTLFFHKGCLYV